MKKTIIIENAEITDVAAEGKAIAKDGDLVIFVPYAVPGDVVDLQLTKKKKNYAEARVVKFHKFSDKREPLRDLRRMQMADSALRGTVAL